MQIVFRLTDDQEASVQAYLESSGSRESATELLTKYLSDYVHQIAGRHPRGAYREKILARDQLDREIREMTKVTTEASAQPSTASVAPDSPAALMAKPA